MTEKSVAKRATKSDKIITASSAAGNGSVLRMASGRAYAALCHAQAGTREHAANAAGLAGVAAASADMTKAEANALKALARTNARAGGGRIIIGDVCEIHTV